MPEDHFLMLLAQVGGDFNRPKLHGSLRRNLLAILDENDLNPVFTFTSDHKTTLRQWRRKQAQHSLLVETHAV